MSRRPAGGRVGEPLDQGEGVGDQVAFVVPPERTLTTNPWWEFDLHASGPRQVHRVVVVEPAETNWDFGEVGDDSVAGKAVLDVPTDVMGEVAVAATEQKR